MNLVLWIALFFVSVVSWRGLFGNEPLELRQPAACGSLATLGECGQLESNQH